MNLWLWTVQLSHFQNLYCISIKLFSLVWKIVFPQIWWGFYLKNCFWRAWHFLSIYVSITNRVWCRDSLDNNFNWLFLIEQSNSTTPAKWYQMKSNDIKLLMESSIILMLLISTYPPQKPFYLSSSILCLFALVTTLVGLISIHSSCHIKRMGSWGNIQWSLIKMTQ